MSANVDDNPAGPPRLVLGSILATRTANTVRYSMMNIFILVGIFTIALGGGWTWTGMALSFVLIGFVDELFGDAGPKELMPPVWYMQLMLYLTLPLLIIATLVAFNITSDTGFEWIDAATRLFGIDPVAARHATHTLNLGLLGHGAWVSLGMYYGAAGVNVAHELVHRTDKPFDRVIGRWLLAFTWDTGFAIEHVHGHHRNVGTDQDPATARRGEYIVVFVFRSTFQQWFSAKRFEADRLKRKGIANNIINNRFWRGQLMTLVIVAFYVAFLGPIGILLSLYSGFIGKIYLEVVNYIEHYGLVRLPGTRVESRHSWDSHRRVSTGMFYNLMLHSNHHAIATRRFWELEQSSEAQAVTLPRGYMAMILFAFLGPPFFKYINKSLGRWDRELASPGEVDLLKSRGIYLGDRA
ncbi:MAG TPA: alkane 1-monooxygenase [Devosia sp.]|nr:alkane 1-monooxygenase [Devosia sp.]